MPGHYKRRPYNHGCDTDRYELGECQATAHPELDLARALEGPIKVPNRLDVVSLALGMLELRCSQVGLPVLLPSCTCVHHRLLLAATVGLKGTEEPERLLDISNRFDQINSIDHSIIRSNQARMAARVTIKLVSSGSETLSVAVPDVATATVRALKQLIEAQDAQRFPVAAQRLIFQGQILQDDKTLSEYGIEDGCALHLTLTPGAARSAPAAPTSAVSIETQLRALLQHMRADAGYATAVQTMQKICENVIAHPHEDKYRKLRLANAALKSRLLDRARGLECVKLLGFADGIEEVRSD